MDGASWCWSPASPSSAGSWIGARLARLSPRESTALSIGLNARGALEIVIATIGLSLGVLNEESYTAIVVMAIATSVLAPPLLRLVLRGWEGRPRSTPDSNTRRPCEPTGSSAIAAS